MESHAASKTPDRIPDALIGRICKYQLKATRPFIMPGLYESIRGLFVSYPTYTMALLRKYIGKTVHIRVPDNNAFVTFWMLELLLETGAGAKNRLAGIRIHDAVKALMEFHDRTRFQDDPLFVFWRQHTVAGHPVAFPANLMPFYRFFMRSDKIMQAMAAVISKIRRQKTGNDQPSLGPKRSSAAFSLPADFDDAALNWSLGSCLYRHRDTFPEAWSEWSRNGFDFTKLARHAVACAYRPFADDRDSAAIDPRSFYAIRDFLWNLRESGRTTPDFALLTTWAATTRSNRDGIQHYYKMPFNINNLDCSVQANLIHAACNAARTTLYPHGVEGFDELLINTAEYLAWALGSGTIVNQPDLALLYYPTPACAFFFISRIVQLLENFRQQASMPPVCAQIETALVPAARTHITAHVLTSAIQTQTTAHWQRCAADGQGLDDRKFLTAASLNCLLNLWTRQTRSGVEWLPGTPAPAVAAVDRGRAWLHKHALAGSDHNAFFSASVKHASSLPFMFPANMREHTMGPALQPRIAQQNSAMMRHSVFAVSGVPDREDYARMLKEKGLASLDNAAFKKCLELDYPYWSAPTVTCALVYRALSTAALLKR